MRKTGMLVLLMLTTACQAGADEDKLATRYLQEAREATEKKIETCDSSRTADLPPEAVLSELSEHPAEQVQQLLVSLAALADYKCHEPESTSLVFTARAITQDQEVSAAVREKAADTARALTSRYFSFLRLHDSLPEDLRGLGEGDYFQNPFDAMEVLKTVESR